MSNERHAPRKGSMGYSPRKRARSHIPHFKSWPKDGDSPKLQGFAGYKAGMTHAFVVDYRPTSTTSRQEVQIPVTVVEVPPIKIAAVRGYESTPYGLRTAGEAWADSLDDELERRLPIPDKGGQADGLKTLKKKDLEDVRVLAYTQPRLLTGVPKSKPDLMEMRVGGGTIEQRLDYAAGILGKEFTIRDYAREGVMVDVASITKGKGFQGSVKRWGVKLLTHKNRKHRRGTGTLGPRNPDYVESTVPQAGQMGYHQRTEYNKRILKIGEKGEEITPSGGFLHYGIIRNPYVLLHGTVPGPAKRLIRFRDAIRFSRTEVESVDVSYISTQSKQGA
jgi:large subunit ribosomal protein L3